MNMNLLMDRLIVLLFVSLFCVLTGIVKFALLMRGAPGMPSGGEKNPYGGAGFPE